MIGKKFNGEPYRIYKGNTVRLRDKLIGIEKRTGERWPDKQWWGYDELTRKLEADNVPVKVFTQQHNIRQYLDDIASCSHIVSGIRWRCILPLRMRKIAPLYLIVPVRRRYLITAY